MSDPNWCVGGGTATPSGTRRGAVVRCPQCGRRLASTAVWNHQDKHYVTPVSIPLHKVPKPTLGWKFVHLYGEPLEPITSVETPKEPEPDLPRALERWACEMARSAKIMDRNKMPDLAEAHRQLAHVLLRALSALQERSR